MNAFALTFAFFLFIICFLPSDAFESNLEFDRTISDEEQLFAIGNKVANVGLENAISNASSQCNEINKCNNRGRCFNSVCVCQPGTSGPFCNIIDGCKELNCGDANTVECAYDERNFKVYCKCKKWDHSYDSDAKECKECKCDDCKQPFCLFPALSCQFVRGEKVCVCNEPNYMYNPNTQRCEFCFCGDDNAVRSCSFDYDGNQKCVCQYGYEFSVRSCKKCNCGYGTCHYEKAVQKCDCFSGYSDDNGYCRQCGCGSNGKCIFDYYRKIGCKCDHGYIEVDGECLEVCYCGDNANCTIQSGKKMCTCPEGFALVNGLCTDINECDDPTTCPPFMDCTNTVGSYECTCKKGFNTSAETNGTCEDINECLLSNPCLESHTECLNTVGSFECVCEPGYATRIDATSISCESKSSWKLGFGLLIGAFVAVIIGLMILIYRRY